jgi:beta-lactamase regulating signal transducer with metallopeptidase domain
MMRYVGQLSKRELRPIRRALARKGKMILLPSSVISGLSVKQLEMILAHELAHIRRHDYLVNLLQSIIETLLFYHPGVWWVSRQIRKEREHCCDDKSVVGINRAMHGHWLI